jgi:GLPGLI family protein
MSGKIESRKQVFIHRKLPYFRAVNLLLFMRGVIFLVLLFLSFQSISQELPKPFSVNYVSGYMGLKDSLQIKNFMKKHRFHGVLNYEITIVDTAALIRPYANEKQRSERILGSGFRSHTMFVDFLNQRQYFQSEPYGVEKFLVHENYRDIQYDLKNDSITILGYTCYKAVLKNTTQSSNVTIMWYAPSLSYSVSHLGFSGLPGLVLASETYQSHSRSVLIAKEIIAETRTIVKPFRGKQVSQQEFFKALENLRQKMNY